MASNGESRPWGAFEVLADEPDHKVKSISVLPGSRLSYQRHEQRSEHWFFVRGRGVVTVDDVIGVVAPGAAVDVPVGAAHRVENTGEDDLVFVEVQRGDYLGEDDIIRLADDYGRAG
jgi:mannose-6-phosphate isomerase-like protein (cupin superfamily)